MEEKNINQALISFLDESPNAFFAVKNFSEMLRIGGAEQLYESESWVLERGKKYFVTRNDSSLISFALPKDEYVGFQIMASHSDSPALKVKVNSEITVEDRYSKLNVEKYGGMICSTWLDRPLSVAGRVVISTANGVETRLINIDRDIMIIPNLAIHMNRSVNDGYSYNAQVDMLPLFGSSEKKDAFRRAVAEAAGASPEDILDADLYLYNRQKGCLVGIEEEYISSPRLDDLQCAFAGFVGFIKSRPTKSVAVHYVADNEEVGSGTKQGAAGTFLKDVLKRINDSAGKKEEDYLRSLASSFMISADNAHALHPNHADKADPTNRPRINGGIVIKYSANQLYTTDAISGAIFRKFCEAANVPYQTFANRSDMAGGSTLGNISQMQVSLNTVDIGLAQLAMHSSFETAGAKDTVCLAKLAERFFSSSVVEKSSGSYSVITG